MFKRLRNKAGIMPVAVGFLGFAFVLSVATLTLPIIKDPFRARKAVDLCYCLETGSSEFVCKAEGAVINPEDQDIIDNCKIKVDGMSKPEILTYIKDDAVMPEKEKIVLLPIPGIEWEVSKVVVLNLDK